MSLIGIIITVAVIAFVLLTVFFYFWMDTLLYPLPYKCRRCKDTGWIKGKLRTVYDENGDRWYHQGYNPCKKCQPQFNSFPFENGV